MPAIAHQASRFVENPAAVRVVDHTLHVGPTTSLSCAQVEHLAQQTETTIFLDEAARNAIQHSRTTFETLRDRGDEIYGSTTGFGPFVAFSADQDGHVQGASLLAHLGAGCGPSAPSVVVRATMLTRIATLARGGSGVRPETLDALIALFNQGIVPDVCEVGSVGASGDLVPLAQIAQVLCGSGRIVAPEPIDVSPDVLTRFRLEPITLEGREGLAMTNGTSFLTAYAACATARATRLIDAVERLTAWLFDALRGRDACLDPRLHAARGQFGQQFSAANIRAARANTPEDTARPLQEVYSVRCAAQVIGAARDGLLHATRVIEREINGIDDNPLIAPQTESEAAAALHGGNFHGQPVSFAADILNAALVQVAVLLERQLAVVLNPQLNGGAPLLLAWEPGRDSGMAGAQLTATAIVAEMRHHVMPSCTASIPTNGDNQDVVSMGTLASRTAFEQTDRLANLCAIQTIALEQLGALRTAGRAPGSAAPRPKWVPDYTPFEHDRALRDDIARLSRFFVSTDSGLG